MQITRADFASFLTSNGLAANGAQTSVGVALVASSHDGMVANSGAAVALMAVCDETVVDNAYAGAREIAPNDWILREEPAGDIDIVRAIRWPRGV